MPSNANEPDSRQDESNLLPQEQLPRLPWKENPSRFQWSLTHVWPANPVPNTQLADNDWFLIGQFVKNLKWQLGDDCVISHAERAFLFYHQGFKCAALLQDEHFTFQALIVWFKMCLKICRKHVPFAIFPGANDSRLHNSEKPCLRVLSFERPRTCRTISLSFLPSYHAERSKQISTLGFFLFRPCLVSLVWPQFWGLTLKGSSLIGCLPTGGSLWQSLTTLTS